MGISEHERSIIINSGSAIRHHSLDSANMKFAREGEERAFGKSKKQVKSELRRIEEDLSQKNRVLRAVTRVIQVKRGFDGYCDEAFVTDARFLRSEGKNPNRLRIPVPNTDK